MHIAGYNGLQQRKSLREIRYYDAEEGALGHTLIEQGHRVLLTLAESPIQRSPLHCWPFGADWGKQFLELAVAAAISLFGFESGAALATVVGVLIEVPMMLSLVKIVNRSQPWYAQGRTTTAIELLVRDPAVLIVTGEDLVNIK